MYSSIFREEIAYQRIRHDLCSVLNGHLKRVEWEIFDEKDWQLFFSTARHEGVASLIFWQLNHGSFLSFLPEKVVNDFKNEYISTVAKNHLLHQQLVEILSVLHSRGISSPILLKGVALANTVYPNKFIRGMGDIDLLLPESEIDIAINSLFENFKYETPEISSGLNKRLAHDIHLMHRRIPGVIIDIHWGIVATKAYDYYAPIDWFLTQTEVLSDSYSLFGIPDVLVFLPEAQLLHMAAHTMLQHGRGSALLLWYYDIFLWLKVFENSLDWKKLVDISISLRWDNALLSLLSDVSRYFEITVPSWVIDELSTNNNEQSYQKVHRKQNVPTTKLLRTLQRWSALNWSSRVKLAGSLVFPSIDYMIWRYKINRKAFLPIYYIYRWLTILWDSLQTIRGYIPSKKIERL